MDCLADFTRISVGDATVFHGSNLDVLPFMADNSVDSIVTDPPYELGFMGKKWDSSGIAYSVELWAECLRVLKPGGHLLAFGGSRTWHRLAVAIEDAGFEVRDSIAWLYGSGFPKSHDVSKAIDKAAGAERKKIRIDASEVRNPKSIGGGTDGMEGGTRPWIERALEVGYHEKDSDTPATPEAEKWAGWGTALKPAFEPVVVARKPLVGNVAENVLAWGVGGLNIDASRIKANGDNLEGGKKGGTGNEIYSKGLGDSSGRSQALDGRWPANIILDEYTAELLDEQSGESKSISSMRGAGGGTEHIGQLSHRQDSLRGHNDSGGASRFFYVAKANKRDRNEGLDELEAKTAAEMTGRKEGSAGLVMKHADGSDKANAYAGTTGSARQNFHPTVKPTDLMRYLIKLVTPAGGMVLDPFTGSGSTGKAALLDGNKFVGIELTDDYLPIIEGRLKWAYEQHHETLEKENEKLF